MNDIERRALIGAAGIGAIAALSKAGPLNPPAGAVAGTAKPLTEVEPRIAVNATNTPGSASATFRITAPGSYYLTGSFAAAGSANGVAIEASDVTLDLNGYTITGGGGGGGNGVVATVAGTTNVRVLHGTVRGFGARGVSLSLATGGVVADVQAIGNGVASPAGGIGTGAGFVVRGCTADGNAGNGISLDINCTVQECLVNASTGTGIVGPSGSLIDRCCSRGNGAGGISVGLSSVVRSCVSAGNTGNGITVTAQCRVESCVCTGNTGAGINAGNTTEVRDNTVTGVSIAGSTAGIVVSTACLVRGNFCRNTGTGIQTTGTDNIIVGNHFAGHTNAYILLVGNQYGPFVVTTLSAAAFTGSIAVPSTMGSTDPNANFID